MSSDIRDLGGVRQLVAATVLDAAFRRGTFGGAARGEPSPWVRVVVRPIDLRGRRHLQISYFDSRKDISKNFLPEEIGPPLDEMLAIGFSGIHLSTASEEIDIRTSKKGKVHIGRRAVVAPEAPEDTHNRAKDLPLPEGRADRLLEVMGIMAADGQVRPTMRAKYTQINEFLKHLSHSMADAGLSALDRPIEILDCGCGSSYLTLAVHHYLNDVLAIPARIVGVDVNDEVIRKSLARANRLGMADLALTCGRIDDIDVRADIVLALHACDTATDDALAQAVRCEARLILAVPCCHKDLNRSIRPEGDAAVLRPLLRHGILRQRTADLVTDAFRAQALRIMGYRTEMVEFVSPEHTARNLMIRAVRGTPVGDTEDVKEYLALKGFWNVTPYIEGALGEEFGTMVSPHSLSSPGAGMWKV